MIFIIIRKLLWHRNLTFLRLILEEINVWKKFVKSIQKQLLNVIRTTMHWFIVKMRFFSWNQLFHFHCNKSCYKLISRNIFPGDSDFFIFPHCAMICLLFRSPVINRGHIHNVICNRILDQLLFTQSGYGWFDIKYFHLGI